MKFLLLDLEVVLRRPIEITAFTRPLSLRFCALNTRVSQGLRGERRGRKWRRSCAEIARTQSSLVILDISMPVLDGFGAVTKIKKILPDVPVLMISTDAGSDNSEISRSVGAQGFVSKAECGQALLKAVDVLLAGGTFFSNADQPADSRIRFGNLHAFSD